MTKRSIYLWAAAVLAVLSLLIYATIGFYYDNPSDVNANYLMNGAFCGSPLYLINTSGGMLYLSYLIKWAYVYFPTGHWTDVYMLALNLLGFFFLFVILLKMLLDSQSREDGSFSMVVLFIGVLLILWSDAFLLIDITKISFILSFASLFLLHQSGPGRSKRVELLCLLSFLIAVLHRTEPTILVWLLHLAYLILVKGIRSIKALLYSNREMPITLGFIILASILVNIPLTDTDRFYASIRPYQFAVWDFKYDPAQLKLQSKEDSAILQATSRYFLADKTKINSGFFERINLKPQDKNPKYLINYLTKGTLFKEKLSLFIQNYLVKYSALLAVMAALILWSFIAERDPSAGRRRLLFAIFYIALLFTVGLVFKMEYHVYIPLFSVFLSYLLIDACSSAPKPVLSLVGGMVCVVLAMFFLFQSAERNTMIRGQQKDIDTILANAEKNDRQILVYNLSTFDKLKFKLFGRETLALEHKNLSVDNGWVYLYPEYDHYMTEQIGCKEYKDVMAYLIAHKQEVVFISTDLRMQVLADYSAGVYQQSLRYEVADQGNVSASNSLGIRFYTLH
jgi:hypothetical protein